MTCKYEEEPVTRNCGATLARDECAGGEGTSGVFRAFRGLSTTGARTWKFVCNNSLRLSLKWLKREWPSHVANLNASCN
jgi:hypothetical protein